VQKNNNGPVGRAGLSVADIQDAGIDLLQGSERGVCPRLDRRQLCRFCLAGLCIRRADHAELGGGDAQGRSAEKAAAMMVDVFGHFDRVHG
jgi:hypothetical protein